MAFASMENRDDNEAIAEINMVPLIDVMLVLLIIFMVTAPLLTHAVKVELPRASSVANLPQADKVSLTIDANSQIYWNGEPVDREQLAARLSACAQLPSPPELQILAERTTPYEKIAQLMSDAAQHGLTRIAFVTTPLATP